MYEGVRYVQQPLGYPTDGHREAPQSRRTCKLHVCGLRVRVEASGFRAVGQGYEGFVRLEDLGLRVFGGSSRDVCGGRGASPTARREENAQWRN